MVTFQFVPYHDYVHLDSDERIDKLLNIVKEDKIVVMEGRLRKKEEADLIRTTMEEISPKFRGIELSVVYPEQKDQAFFLKLRHSFANLLLGDRQGMTIIGPVSVVKKIRQNPGKIELLTKEKRRKKRK